MQKYTKTQKTESRRGENPAGTESVSTKVKEKFLSETVEMEKNKEWLEEERNWPLPTERNESGRLSDRVKGVETRSKDRDREVAKVGWGLMREEREI